jgi:carboxymethylenebutenolidase
MEGAKTALQPRHTLELVSSLKATVMLMNVGQDTGIPLGSVERMREALKQGSAAAKASEFVIYPEAPHAFHADYRPSYREQAARDGWQKMLAWFNKHGVTP